MSFAAMRRREPYQRGHAAGGRQPGGFPADLQSSARLAGAGGFGGFATGRFGVATTGGFVAVVTGGFGGFATGGLGVVTNGFGVGGAGGLFAVVVGGLGATAGRCGFVRSGTTSRLAAPLRQLIGGSQPTGRGVGGVQFSAGRPFGGGLGKPALGATGVPVRTVVWVPPGVPMAMPGRSGIFRIGGVTTGTTPRTVVLDRTGGATTTVRLEVLKFVRVVMYSRVTDMFR